MITVTFDTPVDLQSVATLGGSLWGKWADVTRHNGTKAHGYIGLTDKGLTLTDDNGRITSVKWTDIAKMAL